MVGYMEVKINDLLEIYEKDIKKNTKNKKRIYNFELNKMINIVNAKEKLETKNVICKYNIFIITKPKCRVIMSHSITDKLVNHYITKHILIPKLEKYLDDRICATRKNKGLIYAFNMFKNYLRICNIKYNNFYMLKIDISKYFYSIDHEVLKKLIKDKLTSEEYEIVSKVIDSTNYSYINKKIINIMKKTNINDLPLYYNGKGLSIGLMSNQFLAIYYTNNLIHYIVHVLGLKYTCIYMDDIVCVHHDKKYLYKCLELIKYELENTYKLKLNVKKTKITSINEGVSFIGYRFKKVNNKIKINILKSSIKRIKKRVKEVKYLLNNNLISINSAYSSINGYLNRYKYDKYKIERIIKLYFDE